MKNDVLCVDRRIAFFIFYPLAPFGKLIFATPPKLLTASFLIFFRVATP